MLTLTHALDLLRYGMGRKMTFLRWQLDWIPLPSIDYSKTNFIKAVSRAGAHFVQSTAWDSEMSSAESRHPRWIVLAPKFLDEEMRQLTGKSLLSANMAKLVMHSKRADYLVMCFGRQYYGRTFIVSVGCQARGPYIFPSPIVPLWISTEVCCTYSILERECDFCRPFFKCFIARSYFPPLFTSVDVAIRRNRVA
jgi:hypothetical protein